MVLEGVLQGFFSDCCKGSMEATAKATIWDTRSTTIPVPTKA